MKRVRLLEGKSRIESQCGLPVDEQNLVFGGRALSIEEVLAECGLIEESPVFANLGLDGGAKKRKKKTYTKPKKIKHKRKKVKFAVLKFNKVDSNDKVTRLRRECPHELCGPGVFMAMHHNRYYCGKCQPDLLDQEGRRVSDLDCFQACARPKKISNVKIRFTENV